LKIAAAGFSPKTGRRIGREAAKDESFEDLKEGLKWGTPAFLEQIGLNLAYASFQRS
jgi:hypothetical protein